MNTELFARLAAQAGLRFEEDWVRVGAAASPEPELRALKRFADLVVQECVHIAQQVQAEAEYSHTPKRAQMVRLGARLVEHRIKQYSGVDE